MENRDRSNGVMGDAASPSDLLAAMYERHGGAIMRYMQRRLGDGPAEDAAAEVFVRAIARRGSYVAYRDSELPWLYGIAANVIADSRRAEARRLRALQQIAIRDRKQHADAPGSQVLDPDLVRALRRLSREDRETLLLVVWGELSYAETALALGIPIGTVRSRIARARRRLHGDVRSNGVDERSAHAAATGDVNG